jgi:septal ring factor EnvC (AmiA/AmiB activator)
MVFIFAAEDFNQAYQRLKYFQHYNEYRKKQAELIVEKENQLTEKIRILEQQKAEKQSLLAVQKSEKGQLLLETGEKDKTIRALSRREKELQKTLREKEEAARRLKKAIEDQIAEEIRVADERSKKPGVTMEKTGEISLTPEEVQLSNSFMANKGRLPWPLEKGMISSSFGEHPHPVLSHVMIRNNGIDILTVLDAETRAIFEGVVTRVMNVPSNNNVVIIRHGEYLTVYSNLDRVYVQKGDLVATKQKIGTVYTNPLDSKTELHFEVWQSKTLLDPEEWLAGKR